MYESPELLDPAQINVMQLLSLPLMEKGLLPDAPCVYFVLSVDQIVLYIGRSKNLRERWINHHRYGIYRALPGIRIAWIAASDIGLLASLEAACIQYFSPRDNGNSLGNSVATIHIKTSSSLRDRVLGKLRGRGITMQGFFEDLLQQMSTDAAFFELLLRKRQELPFPPVD